ncbi:MAG: carbohydrate ABC transporter permease [Clostridia bacterium]
MLNSRYFLIDIMNPKKAKILKKITTYFTITIVIFAIIFTYLSKIKIDQGTAELTKVFEILSIIFIILSVLAIAALIFMILLVHQQNEASHEYVYFRKPKKKIHTFDVLNYIFMALFMCMCVYPMIYVLVGSFNVGSDYAIGGVYFLPRKFTFENYKIVLENAKLWTGYAVTIGRTIIGTVTSLLFTAMVAYAMSRRNLKGRKWFYWINMFTMFFGGGLIPFFLIIKTLGMLNTFWVYIVPSLYSVYNMIIISTFFSGISEELHESALMDGAGEFRIFYKIFMPLSKPVLATVALWIAIGHWNSFFDVMIYNSGTPSLHTLQYFLLNAIQTSTMTEGLPPDMMQRITPKTIALAAIVISVIPVFFFFPLVQKNFKSGIMIGSLKG